MCRLSDGSSGTRALLLPLLLPLLLLDPLPLGFLLLPAQFTLFVVMSTSRWHAAAVPPPSPPLLLRWPA